MAMTNVGVAYELMERVRSAMMWYDNALELLPSVPFRSEVESIASKTALLAHLGRAKKTAADWSGGESGFDELWHLVRIHMLAYDRPSALLPFDTLLYPMTPSERKQVAIVHSRQFDALHIGRGTTTSASHYQQKHLESSRLHVGFVSYDFSDHPTTHLMEGVFALVNRSQSKLIAFGYGRNDGSESRQRIVSSADKFVNLAAESFEDSASLIRDEHIHIFMDAQGHTRGGRMKIAGFRPAPIIVNYLVYPGTSGAAFIDYIICDAFVTPPAEFAGAFTEKLVLLPNSYQVNYYEIVGVHRRSELWALPSSADLADHHSRLHLDSNIDPKAFVFVNFNKIDKLESQVFGIWMAIMRRVPRSVLLLLDPSRSDGSTETSEEAKANLFREARVLGISASRIQLLPRLVSCSTDGDA
jgi:protein O-GlcNAc transferase